MLDRETAGAYLRAFGLEAHIDEYLNYGGYVLGLNLARSCPHVRVPDDATLRLTDVLRLSAAQVEGILQRFPEGFGIKYSGYREAFSPFAARGINSSRHRFWNGEDEEAARKLIATSIAEAPEDARTLVVQPYLKPPSLSAVIYAHVYEDRILLETVAPKQRVLAIFEHGVLRVEKLDTPHVRCTSDQQVRLRRIGHALQKVRAHLGFNIDVECFQQRNVTIVVQLRPIPYDFNHKVKPAAASVVRRYAQHALGAHVTPWVYGVWDELSSMRLGEDTLGRPAIMAKRSKDIRSCKPIMARLERGDPTLVIDCVDGFRLTHSPSCLPASLIYREYFSCISVAGSPLAQIEDGKFIAAASDGNVGIVKRARRHS